MVQQVKDLVLLLQQLRLRLRGLHPWPRKFHKQEKKKKRSRGGAAKTNPTRNLEVVGLIPGLAQWVKDPASP